MNFVHLAIRLKKLLNFFKFKILLLIYFNYLDLKKNTFAFCGANYYIKNSGHR